jgi:hypothetical protein
MGKFLRGRRDIAFSAQFLFRQQIENIQKRGVTEFFTEFIVGAKCQAQKKN